MEMNEVLETLFFGLQQKKNPRVAMFWPGRKLVRFLWVFYRVLSAFSFFLIPRVGRFFFMEGGGLNGVAREADGSVQLGRGWVGVWAKNSRRRRDVYRLVHVSKTCRRSRLHDDSLIDFFYLKKKKGIASIELFDVKAKRIVSFFFIVCYFIRFLLLLLLLLGDDAGRRSIDRGVAAHPPTPCRPCPIRFRGRNFPNSLTNS